MLMLIETKLIVIETHKSVKIFFIGVICVLLNCHTNIFHFHKKFQRMHAATRSFYIEAIFNFIFLKKSSLDFSLLLLNGTE
jgi:hypothetical protein